MSTTGVPAVASTGDAVGSSPRAGTATPRPMRADAQRNYQRLLDAALAVFAEHGADDASLEEIARRAGVGIGTLYRHFPTRQALLEAVYRDQVDGMRAKADELLESDSPSEALAEWLRALSAFSSTKRSLTAALLETLGTESELLSACSAVIYGAADEMLTRAKETGAIRPDVDGRDLMRLVHGVNIAAQHTPTDPGQRDRLIGIILDGLKPQG